MAMAEGVTLRSSEGDVDSRQLALALEQLGCPAAQSETMANQLVRRADQLAAMTGRPKAAALRHLLELMKQGWAAQAK